MTDPKTRLRSSIRRLSDDFHTKKAATFGLRYQMQAPKDAYYNRIDILDAHYWFARDFHDGQMTPLHARLTRIMSIYNPSPFSYGPQTDNAKNIYTDLQMKAQG